VLIKGRAGLGNRMLGAISGILYAEITGRRPIVDWRGSSYSHDREHDPANLFHHLFDSPGIGDVGELPDAPSVWPPVWEGRLDQHPRHFKDELSSLSMPAFWRATSADPSRAGYAQDVVVWWSFVSAVEWMRPLMDRDAARRSAVELQRDVMARQLRPRSAIRERIEAFASQHLGGPSVGVHVRYTDRRSRLGAIERELERCRAARPGARVLVATDNREVRDQFARRWDAVSAPHWYPEPGERLHKNPQDPDRLEGAVAALVDLHLLGRCDQLVGDGSSSFTMVAALLCTGHFHDARPLRARWREPVKRAWGRAARSPARPLALAVSRSFRR
jgi:nodulation protein Z